MLGMLQTLPLIGLEVLATMEQWITWSPMATNAVRHFREDKVFDSRVREQSKASRDQSLGDMLLAGMKSNRDSLATLAAARETEW